MGATLDERLAHVQRDASTSTAPDTDEQAVRDGLLAMWRRACTEGDERAFARRLSWDGIERSAALAAMATRAPGDFPTADWLPWISAVADEARLCAPMVGSDAWEREISTIGADVPFGDLWLPAARIASRRLTDVAASHARRISASAIHALERQLLRELSGISELAALEDFRAWVAAQPDDPPETGYRRYVQTVLAAGLTEFFETYPVLARQSALLAAQWVEQTSMLLARASDDRESIESAFGGAAEDIATVVPALSDRHERGGRVAFVEFTSGVRLAYKPRDVRIERAFHDTLRWLRAHGLENAPPALVVLDRGTHGWSEWVDAEPVSSTTEASAYFRSAGALACLAYILGGTDLHGENVIATARGPVLVDTEMLLQPSANTAPNAGGMEDHRQPRAPRESCLTSGLVSAIVIDRSGKAHDLGGLRHVQARELAVPVREWRNLRRSDIGFETKARIHPSLGNDVRLDGNLCPPEQFVDDVCAGFEIAYQFLERHGAALLNERGPLTQLANVVTRVLFRPSNQYATTQYLLASPRYQRRGLDRSLAIETLSRVFAGNLERPAIWPLVYDERTALEGLEIPRQTLPADARDLQSSTGQTVSGYYAVSGIDGVLRRLSGLSPDDRAFQVSLLRSALADEAFDDVKPLDTPIASRCVPTAPRDTLCEAAEYIGRALLRRAESGIDGVDGCLRWRSSSGQADLYGGSSGIALFFAVLGSVTGNAAWRDAARRSLGTCEAATIASAEPDASRIGACTGRPSTAYALLSIGHHLNDRALVDAAGALALATSKTAIEEDRLLDIEGGAAGALAAFLAIDAYRPDDRLRQMAERCVARLRSTQIPSGPDRGGWHAGVDAVARTGFAHGAAGIAYALGRWFERSGDRSVLPAITDAWAFERRLWAERRETTSGRPRMTAWCHGMPGMALARALVPAEAGGDAVAADIDGAMGDMLGAPDAPLDHLCCGNMGRADVALTIGLRTHRRDWMERGVQLAETVSMRILAQGRLGLRARGFWEGAPAPDLMQGIAGIGYQLLRAAAPAAVASVLAFEPPAPPVETVDD